MRRELVQLVESKKAEKKSQKCSRLKCIYSSFKYEANELKSCKHTWKCDNASILVAFQRIRIHWRWFDLPLLFFLFSILSRTNRMCGLRCLFWVLRGDQILSKKSRIDDSNDEMNSKSNVNWRWRRQRPFQCNTLNLFKCRQIHFNWYQIRIRNGKTTIRINEKDFGLVWL